MFEKLEVMTMAGAMAKNASDRQSVVAQNIAHADTPGYLAKHVAPFSETYEASSASEMKRTRDGHYMDGDKKLATITQITTGASPNGNTVSLEDEMLNSVNVNSEHDRALAIYKHSLDLMRLSIGRK